MQILKRSFYTRDTVLVAQELLGKLLVSTSGEQRTSGIIVETEAYTGADDPASHAYRGQTPRNRAMFGPPGHAYIYFIYGNHFCLNAVAHLPEAYGGVLIRALLPVEGIEVMETRRKNSNPARLTNGPGNLTQSLGIDMSYYSHDLTTGQSLYFAEPDEPVVGTVQATPRVGIRNGTDKLWRFVLKIT